MTGPTTLHNNKVFCTRQTCTWGSAGKCGDARRRCQPYNRFARVIQGLGKLEFLTRFLALFR